MVGGLVGVCGPSQAVCRLSPGSTYRQQTTTALRHHYDSIDSIDNRQLRQLRQPTTADRQQIDSNPADSMYVRCHGLSLLSWADRQIDSSTARQYDSTRQHSTALDSIDSTDSSYTVRQSDTACLADAGCECVWRRHQPPMHRERGIVAVGRSCVSAVWRRKRGGRGARCDPYPWTRRPDQ
eukprot:915785-Prymnesium_polylepis.1